MVYREDDIEIQTRTTTIPIRDMAQFAKDCIAAAVNSTFLFMVMQPKILTNEPKRKIAYVILMRIKRGFGVHVQSSKLVLLAFLGITMP